MREFRRQEKLMGCQFELIVLEENEKRAYVYLSEGVNEIRRIERLLSEFDPESETSLINGSAGLASVRVTDETFNLLKRSVQLSKLAQGAFDVTVGPLKKLYDFRNASAVWPENRQIAAALQLVGTEKLVLGEEHTVFLTRKQMHISFSAIGKGYAADKVCALWRSMGVQSGVVNASGDLAVVGQKPDGTPWTVGIADPADRDRIFCTLPITNGAVATSGDYEQYFFKDGVRFGHNINPKTGRPVSGVSSVTVFGPGAELCDALATSVYVLGVDVGLHLIDQLPGTSCLIIGEGNRLYQSSNLQMFYA